MYWCTGNNVGDRLVKLRGSYVLHETSLFAVCKTFNRPCCCSTTAMDFTQKTETICLARQHDLLIWFVLSAHTSHLFQPFDIAAFGPFKKHFYSKCSQFIFRRMSQTITKTMLHALACPAYLTHDIAILEYCTSHSKHLPLVSFIDSDILKIYYLHKKSIHRWKL